MSEREPELMQMQWRFAVEVVDEVKLRAFGLEVLHGEDGEVEGVVDFPLDQLVGLRLMRVAEKAWAEMADELGVRHIGGGWPRAWTPPDPGGV